MTDYWLSKLFFDLQNPAAAAEYRRDRAPVLARYPLDEAVHAALLRNDVSALAERVNPYLLRFYFSVAGMADRDFIAALQPGGQAHG